MTGSPYYKTQSKDHSRPGKKPLLDVLLGRGDTPTSENAKPAPKPASGKGDREKPGSKKRK